LSILVKSVAISGKKSGIKFDNRRYIDMVCLFLMFVLRFSRYGKRAQAEACTLQKQQKTILSEKEQYFRYGGW
jgi:transcriptional antiterminator Rof (Rho-off)